MNKWYALQLVLIDPRLTGTAKSVFGRLLDHHNSKTGLCFPSQERLSTHLGCTVRSIRNAIRLLENLHYVKTLIGCGPNGSNLYELSIPSGKSAYQRAEKALQRERNAGSSKPSKEPFKKPYAKAEEARGPVKPTAGFRDESAKKTNTTAASRQKIEHALVTRFGGGEEAWIKLQSIPSAYLDDAANSVNNSLAEVDEAVAVVLRKCQIDGLFGTNDAED